MSRVVGVVLAAGRGSRFAGGQRAKTDHKLLATLDDEPIVRRAALSLAVDGVDRTTAIVGHEATAIREALGDAVDETIENPDYDDGQSTSVRLGARWADELDADAALFLPGDMPLVDPTTTRRLVAASQTTAAEGNATPDAIVPTSAGRRGNPVCFDASAFDALASLSGDTGGRALFDELDVTRVPVDDPGIHVDVDTVADLERLRRSGRDRENRGG